MRRPVNYDALRQAEQQASAAGDAAPQPEAAAQLDSAKEAPDRPANNPRAVAQFTADGRPQEDARVGPPVLQTDTTNDWAKEIAEAAKESADAAARAKEQDKGKG